MAAGTPRRLANYMQYYAGQTIEVGHSRRPLVLTGETTSRLNSLRLSFKLAAMPPRLLMLLLSLH